MGQCCSGIEEGENQYVNVSTNEHRQINGRTEETPQRIQHVRPIVIRPACEATRPTASSTLANRQVARDKLYPRQQVAIVLPKEIIENERRKRISYRCKVNQNIGMLRNILRSLNINNLEVPTKLAYTAEILDTNSKHYQFALSKLRNKKFNNEYRIKGIVHVWNPFLFAQYKLRKLMTQEPIQQRLLFHGTQAENLKSILTHNFDWRKVENAQCGWGVSFANNPWYASHYSIKSRNGMYDYVMILAKVLVGQTSFGDSTTRVPSFGDTTTRRQDEQVFVKYDDCSFYPEFVIYFEKRGF